MEPLEIPPKAIRKVTKGEHTYYMDGYLQKLLNIGIDMVKKDWDFVACYDGYEGSGKSVKCMQDAYFVDPTFNVNQVCFTSGEFLKAIREAKPFQAIVYDEAYTGMDSRGAMSMINRAMKKMIAEVRQKKLFIFIVMPTFFDLDKYQAIHRSRYLIHVYVGPKYQRGYFEFYDRDAKKNLYLKGKKLYDYSQQGPNFRGRFTNYYVIDEKLYRNRKNNSLGKHLKDSVDSEIMRQVQKDLFVRVMTHEDLKGLSLKEKCAIIDLTVPTYYNWVSRYKETNTI